MKAPPSLECQPWAIKGSVERALTVSPAHRGCGARSYILSMDGRMIFFGGSTTLMFPHLQLFKRLVNVLTVW